jgi:hypothetical protein
MNTKLSASATVHQSMENKNDQRQTIDDNPFRVNSPRNVLARARERIQLIRHWLIRHDVPDAQSRRDDQDRQ